MTILSRNAAAVLLSASLPVVHIQAFTSTSVARRTSPSSLFYKDVNKDDEIYTFPNNLDLPEMSSDWKPEMPSYPQGISPFDGFEESDQAMHDISSPLSTKPVFEDENDVVDQREMATSLSKSSGKKARSKTNMYKRVGSSSFQMKTDGTSRQLSSNVSWLPATLAAAPNTNSVMEHVQTKPISIASSLVVSSKSYTPLQSDEASVQQLPIKRFSIKYFSFIKHSYEKLNEKVFNYGEVSQFAAKLDYMVSQRKIALLQMASYEKLNEKVFNYGEVSQFAAKLDYMVSQRKIALLQMASYEKLNEKVFHYGEVSQFAAKLDYMVSQRKIALLQMASVLNKYVRRCKRIATRELRQRTARIYALISNMDITSYRLPRLNICFLRKSMKQQDNSSIAAIPSASASSKYLSSLRVRVATSTLEKPTIATIRYLDVLPRYNSFDEVAL